MSGNQFDGDAFFFGDGFMPPHPAESSSTSSARTTEGLIPLTVKQINDAIPTSSEEISFVVDGVAVNTVHVLGMVHGKQARDAEVDFYLYDGTGMIQVHRWINEFPDIQEVESFQDGMYVHVFGHLKGFQGTRELIASKIRPVVDYNEITYHFFECMYVHSYNIKLQKPGNSTEVAGTCAINRSQAIPPPEQQFPEQHGEDGIQPIEQLILDYLKLPSSLAREKGVNWDELAGQLNVTMPNMMQSMKTLEAKGLVYSTIDDCHFKSTNASFGDSNKVEIPRSRYADRDGGIFIVKMGMMRDFNLRAMIGIKTGVKVFTSLPAPRPIEKLVKIL